jgi:prephenate dehydrogenase
MLGTMTRAGSRESDAREREKLDKLVIFGVGLIGGSLALALKRNSRVRRVIGVDRSPAHLRAALKLGIIDEVSTDFVSAVKDAQLIVLAVPLAQFGMVLRKIAADLPHDTVITDVGSTKRDVIATARRYLGAAFPRFVPAHPIAGTEHSGPQAAKATLFDGNKLVVTPEPDTDARALRRVIETWKSVGAKIITMSAREHDRIFALVSHLPHIISFALVDQIAAYKDADQLFKYSGGGFRDTTRIAGSSPEMWRDICLANRDALLLALDDYLRELKEMRRKIKAHDGAVLESRFTVARAARHKWLKHK